MNFLLATYIFGLSVAFIYILHHLYPSVKVKVYSKEDTSFETGRTEKQRAEWLQDQRDKINNESALEG